VCAIALKMLFHDRAKYLGLILGVTFSTLLVNQQTGIFLGLLSRAAAITVDVPQASRFGHRARLATHASRHGRAGLGPPGTAAVA
jgi:hypothetical protein